MAFRKNVLQEDVILCELYVDTCDGPDNSDNESLERDSDVSATSSHKQLRSSVVVVISDSETRGVCPTHHRTWHFCNNSNTNEDSFISIQP